MIFSSGLTAKLADFFIQNCPHLEVLRDVASWEGQEEGWKEVAERAEKVGLTTGWARKTNRSMLYTINYDAAGWYQVTSYKNIIRNDFFVVIYRLCSDGYRASV